MQNGILSSKINYTIINSNSKKSNVYELDKEPKEIYTLGNTICFNLGTELVFVNNRGILIKKYLSNQEIQGVILGDNVAGILYNNEIKIIDI